MSVEMRRRFGFREALGKDFGIAQRGVVFSCAASVAIIVLSLPFFNWIQIVNGGAMYETFKLKASEAFEMQSGYSVFNVLSLVQGSKKGILGIFAMVCLLLMVATLFFHLSFLVRVLLRRRQNGLLSLYSSSQTAMVFSVLTCAAVTAYVIFANAQFETFFSDLLKMPKNTTLYESPGQFSEKALELLDKLKTKDLFFINGKFTMPGFSLSPIVSVIPVLAIAAYFATKILERPERIKNHEHGFFMEVKRNWVLFLFLIPAFIYIMINNYLPMAGAYVSFIKFNYADGIFFSPFVGFDNFQFLAGEKLWLLSRNTVLYNIAFIGLGNVLQIVFAILVSQVAVKWFKRTSQTLIFMPYFVSFVILRVLVFNLFEDRGIINSLITSMGGEKVNFYQEASYWPWFIIFFYIWKNLGYGMVIYLATIMGINDEYYDAAKVDGANIWQQIRFITLPHLKPTFIILLLYSLGSIMRGQFELFYQMIGTNGPLYNLTDIFDTYVYRVAMSQPLSIGLGTAAGLFQSLFGLILIVSVNFLIKRKHAEYALF